MTSTPLPRSQQSHLPAYALASYCAAILVVALYCATRTTPGIVHLPKIPPIVYSPAPDFSSFAQVADKKSAFFNYLRPIVIDENMRIEMQRDALMALEQLFEKYGRLNTDNQKVLQRLTEEYEVDRALALGKQIEALMLRVDIVPVGLALAQAANESAWGNSRFAREGYNFFGQWCYREGCGFVPKRRNKGARHEVARFPGPGAGVRSYLNNINTHFTYETLREHRAALRQAGRPLGAATLVSGLIRYSERGEAYVAEIRDLIHRNKLDKAEPVRTEIGTR